MEALETLGKNSPNEGECVEAVYCRSLGNGRVPFVRRFAIVAICVVMTLGVRNAGSIAYPQEIAVGPDSSMPNVRWFDVPEQALASALQAYSATSGVQVLYESRLANARRSVGVRGEFTPEAALELLLGKTDLVAYYTRANAITLALRSAGNPNAPPSHLLATPDFALDTLRVEAGVVDTGQRDFDQYTVMIQAEIQNALQESSAAISGSYRVGLELWLADRLSIQRAKLFQSSGEDSRDDAVLRALDGLVFSEAAPKGMPQPIRVLITVRLR